MTVASIERILMIRREYLNPICYGAVIVTKLPQDSKVHEKFMKIQSSNLSECGELIKTPSVQFVV